MTTLSRSQQKLVEHVQAGNALILNPKDGRFVLQTGGDLRSLDQRPVEALLLGGVLEMQMSGHCRLVPESERVQPVAAFKAGQLVRWSQIVRGVEQASIEVEVVSATGKQVRIRTGAGDRVVRPRSLHP